MLMVERSSENLPVQELQRLHKSPVAEAAVLCASVTTTVVYPRHVSLSDVTTLHKHDVACCPITRVAQDAFYAARGVSYVPNTGKATVEWFLDAEQKELLAAALDQPAVCNSLKARSMAVTVLAGCNCQYNVQLLDAIAHLASSRCGSPTNVVCGSTPTYSDGFRASAISEAARSTRMGFLVGSDADAYLKARSAAFEATGAPLPAIGECGAVLVVTYAIKASSHDAHVHAASRELVEGYGRSSNIDSFSSEIQRVIAQIFSDVGLPPQSELFQPLPKSTEFPFMDHVVSIHNEFFSMLMAPPEVRRSAEADGPPPMLRSTDVYVRFVPKHLRCENPVTAHTCFHGMLLCYPDKVEQLYEYLREARQADRNPLYGIAAPTHPRQEAIGIHVMVLQAHAVALEDNVTSYGLLGSPGKRLHRDGNYVMRMYRQLLDLTPQLLEQHFLLPCTFQSCIPLKEEVGQAFFGALDDCHATFAEHFGDVKKVPTTSIARPSTCEFEQQGPEEAALTRAIGLGFGSPAMRIGQLVAHLQACGDDNHMCPDALVALLMSALSTLGPQATVLEAFSMAKDVVTKRDNRLKEAEESVRMMAIEVERLATSSVMVGDNNSGDAVAGNDWSTNVQTVTASCDIPPLLLSFKARDKLMAALGLEKGAGGVRISTPVDVHGSSEVAATKIVKLLVSALNLQGVSRDIVEECKTVCVSVSAEGTTQMRIEAVARLLVNMTTDTEMYVAVVGTPYDRDVHSTAYTSFHHIRRDGGVRKVMLCHVLEAVRPAMVVVNHMSDRDECYWYKPT